LTQAVEELTEGAARRLRIRGQLLDPRVPASRGPAQVAATLVGVQAQDLVAASLSIRARTEGLVVGDVERAATDPASHPLVLTWTLRGTRHLHHAADVRWLLAMVGPTFSRPGARQQQLGVAGTTGDRAVQVLADALAGGARPTRRDVADLLAGHGVDPTGQAPIHVIRRAALEGVLCILPGPGGDARRERYVSLDRWVPEISADRPGVSQLVRRYLAAYGPATPNDLVAWSGLAPGVVATGWREVSDDDELLEVRIPNGPAWRLAAHCPPDPGPVATRLLGAFDTLILGYADRSLHLHPDHARAVNAGGGRIKPVVVTDGRVVATWKLRRAQGKVQCEVTPFPATPGRTDTDTSVEVEVEVEVEVDDIERFLRA
jgi:hypothetical protein